MKKNYSLMNVVIGVMMALCVSFGLQSCGQLDNPLENLEIQEIVNTISENTGATPEEVTALIKEAMSDEAIQEALASGEPIEVEVAGGSSTTASNQTITIPMTTAGVGQNKVVIDLTFTGTITATEDTPLEFKANTGADAGADDSDNQLNINMPAATGLVITINLPKTTVVLTSNGSGTVYKTVNSKTAMETLIISEGVTVEELLIADGTVIVKEGGKVESYVYQPDDNEEKLIIKEDGSVEPQKVNIHGEEKFELRHENGDPYYASNLKVRKGEADYANIFFINSDPNNNPLKVVTICDGAVLKTNWVCMEAIEGQGTAEIKYRLEMTYPPTFTDNSAPGQPGTGPLYYQYQCDFYHVNSIKNIIFSQPEIVLSQYVQEQVEEKESQGYTQRPTMLNLDINGSVEDCEFNYDYVHFCPWISYPLVKGCKFVPTGNNTDKNIIEFDMLDPRGNNFDVNSSYSMSFNGCSFGANFIFKGSFGTMSQGTIDFTDCEYDGQSIDNIDLLNQIIYCQMIISINGVPKYQSSFDADSPTQWKVSAID